MDSGLSGSLRKMPVMLEDIYQAHLQPQNLCLLGSMENASYVDHEYRTCNHRYCYEGILRNEIVFRIATKQALSNGTMDFQQ